MVAKRDLNIAEPTYAQRLGWEAKDRVVLFHSDDAGMSYESNIGVLRALQGKVARSASLMVPCGWAWGMAAQQQEVPTMDIGLHITLTAEWQDYRWGPVSGWQNAKSLIDGSGAFHRSVDALLRHAELSEIEAEIYAQLQLARRMGIQPTHLDTHMGVLWASMDLVDLYVRIGISENLPVLFPAGHNTLVYEQAHSGPLAPFLSPCLQHETTTMGEKLWQAGLPVVDDLYVSSYDWTFPENMLPTDENLRSFKTAKYKELLHTIRPGITVILVHCTDASAHFRHISKSGITRKGDLLAMTDPDLHQFLEDEGILLTDWQDLTRRRRELPNNSIDPDGSKNHFHQQNIQP
jgi:hypothetical protein